MIVMTELQLTPRKFSRGYKLTWSLANFGTSIVSGVYGALLLNFFQGYLDLSASLFGTASFIYAIWNAINDPLFGFISDASKSKHGRRIPFMRFSAPFLALSFIAIWLVPTNFTKDQIFWWLLITMLLYDTFYTIIGLMYSALLPEITESDQERGELQKYSSIFYLLGLVLGFLLPDLLRPKVGGSLAPLYAGVIGIGILGGVCVLITSYRVKERPEFTKVDKPLGLWPSIKYTFKSKSFLILTAANFMSILMQQILLSDMFYLADYVLGQVSVILPLAAVIIGLLFGTFVANRFASKIGVVQTTQLLLIISGVPLILLSVVPSSVIYICLPFAGFGLSGPLVLTNVLFAQVADEDEIKSGVRREAVFFGINALITKPAQSVSLVLAATLVEGAGFVSAINNVLQPQPAAVLISIRILVGFIPGLAMLAGALILHWYPLRGSRLKTIQMKVLEMHAEKAVKLKQQQERSP